MNVSPTRSIVMLSPCSTISRSGNAAPWLTKYAGPSSGTGRTGVIDAVWLIFDALGQFAGFALKYFFVHAFCNVVNLDGSCLI